MVGKFILTALQKLTHISGAYRIRRIYLIFSIITSIGTNVFQERISVLLLLRSTTNCRGLVISIRLLRTNTLKRFVKISSVVEKKHTKFKLDFYKTWERNSPGPITLFYLSMG